MNGPNKKPTLGPKRGIRGRNAQVSTMVGGRQYAIGVDCTTITFECKRAGHIYKINYGKKSLPVSRRMGPGACRFMAGWWSKEKGGCIGECPECLKEEKATSTAS